MEIIDRIPLATIPDGIGESRIDGILCEKIKELPRRGFLSAFINDGIAVAACYQCNAVSAFREQGCGEFYFDNRTKPVAANPGSGRYHDRRGPGYDKIGSVGSDTVAADILFKDQQQFVGSAAGLCDTVHGCGYHGVNGHEDLFINRYITATVIR